MNLNKFKQKEEERERAKKRRLYREISKLPLWDIYGKINQKKRWVEVAGRVLEAKLKNSK